MASSEYAAEAKSFRLPSNTTLGARFIQDSEQGVDAGVCVAAVTPGGAADKCGISVGMLMYGVMGKPVASMPFNGAPPIARLGARC
jgi:C-terminal processing protease CtpA/Prc